MSELRLEDEAMVISTTIERAIVAEQNQSEEAVDMATGGLPSQHSLVLSLPIVPEQDLRVSLSASPSPPTQVTGPVLTPEGGNRVMNEDDPATIGIQKSTPVDESETVDASTLGSNPVEMIDPAPNPLVDLIPTLPLDQPPATFWMPQSTHQIDVEAVLDPPMIHTEDISIFRTKLERVKTILHSEDASSVSTSSESGSTSIITDEIVKAKWYEFLELSRGGHLSIVTDPSVDEKVKTLLSELCGSNICFTGSPRFRKRCEEFLAQFLSGVDTYKQNCEKIATLALWEKRRRLSHESVESVEKTVENQTAQESVKAAESLVKETDDSNAPAQTQESRSPPAANTVDDREEFEEIPETATMDADIQGELQKDKGVQIERPNFEQFQGQTSHDETILSVLLEIKEQQSALREDMQNSKTIVEEMIQNVKLQVEQNMATIEKAIGQCMSKFEDAVQNLEYFQLVRVPFKP
ncbi:uncharacterized protein LOC115680512 [Syzygium oleosum]|uniref:uncharacterized protein LOC115680512 n=1 Tax=Syzygium oleosum TaxID=219896 RepID=UPI0024BB6EBA|nr:uncharacterized protein LOC115680512 [Syzygium oleosum]